MFVKQRSIPDRERGICKDSVTRELETQALIAVAREQGGYHSNTRGMLRPVAAGKG